MFFDTVNLTNIPLREFYSVTQTLRELIEIAGDTSVSTKFQRIESVGHSIGKGTIDRGVVPPVMIPANAVKGVDLVKLSSLIANEFPEMDIEIVTDIKSTTYLATKFPERVHS